MASTESLIWLAIKRRIESLPLTPQLPFAWPASDFAPTTGAAFIAVNNIIAPPRRIMIGKGAHDRTGTLTLVLAYPLGQAMEVSQEVAGQMAAHFPEDLCLVANPVRVRMTSKAHVQEGYRDGTWWRIPVNCPWRSFA